jgi:NAD+ kinase
MESIAIIVNTIKDPDLSFTGDVVDFLSREGVQACVRGAHDEDVALGGGWDRSADCDFALVIGGDGTMLRAIRLMGDADVPFLGINLGTMGFLEDVEIPNWKERLHSVLNGHFRIEERMMLRLNDGETLGDALNEVAVKHSNAAGVGEFKVFSNGVMLGHYSADGILVVAPTGSTAYSLSAGGPIVNPRCSVAVIQPLNPHSLNNRSIVVNSDEMIGLEFDASTSSVSVDGERVNCSLGSVTVSESPKKAKFIKFLDYNFYGVLFEKIKQTNYLRGGLS